MAFVDIPKDLDEIKTKVALGLTKRQLIGFAAAAVIGIPVYLTTRHAVGNDLGLILMITCMALPVLYAIYDPKGMTVEQVVTAWLQFHFISKGLRPYQNVNLYDVLLEMEVVNNNGKGKNALSKANGEQKGGSNSGNQKTRR